MFIYWIIFSDAENTENDTHIFSKFCHALHRAAQTKAEEGHNSILKNIYQHTCLLIIIYYKKNNAHTKEIYEQCKDMATPLSFSLLLT